MIVGLQGTFVWTPPKTHWTRSFLSLKRLYKDRHKWALIAFVATWTWVSLNPQLGPVTNKSICLFQWSPPRPKPSQRLWRPKRLCSKAYTARGGRRSGLLRPSVAPRLCVSAGSQSTLARVLLVGTSKLHRHLWRKGSDLVQMMVNSDQSMKRMIPDLNDWCTASTFVVESKSVCNCNG